MEWTHTLLGTSSSFIPRGSYRASWEVGSFPFSNTVLRQLQLNCSVAT